MSGGSWFLEVAALRPHRSRYWLTPRVDDPAAFAAEVQAVCDVYADAPVLHAQGAHVVSTDEMTGIQALERAAPTLPTPFEKHSSRFCIVATDVTTVRRRGPVPSSSEPSNHH